MTPKKWMGMHSWQSHTGFNMKLEYILKCMKIFEDMIAMCADDFKRGEDRYIKTFLTAILCDS